MFWNHDSLNTSDVEVKMLIPPILFSLIFVRTCVCVCVCVCVIECTHTFFMFKCEKVFVIVEQGIVSVMLIA